ncbi:maltose alpha-D-glucosyltransferase/ alpha-amylase [Bryocella elongata]|uniref:Maltokinase n=1 Tax=Bryocella elongata TaxID=863522 RepID=A0A1H5WPE1_9BACT|nr:maltose alpha-D-glucosyltransferase [Bryocella elongata]SEG01175.1 maltose alpha-D-glucosyltransferase/ alpha-amylase [Bryocella elongata]
MIRKQPASTTDPLWYKDAVIYELHVKAFADSNADGIGDFQGLISRLDYLSDLGVTCLWILPFFPSPLRDDGYDIADYVSVNPSYGTIQDFRQFLDAAHARNMQVMIELVINHTSDQHPWFQKARRAPKGSPEREMYVWSDTDKLFEGVRIIFTDTEKSNWTWDEVAQQYYWHRFFSHQPDLNFDNPQVMHEVLTAMRFWLDMGVDGLRLDAIPYLVERDGTSCENVPETHVLIKQIRAVIDAEYENRLILAEANMWPADVRPYFGDGDECHMAFHFPLMPRIYMALRQEDRLPITDIMAQTPAIPANCQWGLFLRNHDELTLEMVTDDERDYMYLAYSADPRMRINVGIRRRLAPLLDNNRRRIELLNSLLFSFPGTPILYYGDEIGMGDNIYLGDRNGVRTPMQWNSDRNAGFSKAVPARLYFPVIMDPIWGYQAINVEAQESDPSSLLHWTRNMIALRKLFQVFGRGTLEFLHPDNRKILAYIREYKPESGYYGDDGQSQTVLCVANLSRFAQPVQLDLSRYAGRVPVEMLGYVPFPTIDNTPYALTLAPYSFFWLELQQAAPQQAPFVDAPATLTAAGQQITQSANVDAAVATPAPVAQTPGSLNTLGDIAGAQGVQAIEAALPAFLARQRWFGAKSRTIAKARIAWTTPVPQTSGVLAGIEVEFEDGGKNEIYQLPLATASGKEATAVRADATKSILTALEEGGETKIVYDATASEAFRHALKELICGAQEVAAAGNLAQSDSSTATYSLVAANSAGLKKLDLNVDSRVGSVEQSNTSILFGDRAILKLFRRLRSGENPDVEITRFLTDVAHFPHIAPYLGDLHIASDATTIAFLQVFSKNEGDGWQWMQSELINFLAAVKDQPAPAVLEKVDPLATFLPPAELTAAAGVSLEAAATLGRITAELHRALATPTADAGFAAEAYDDAALARERKRITAQVTHALNALEDRASSFSGDQAELAQKLTAQRARLMARVEAIGGLQGDAAASFGQRIRVHGDYHLGQTLRTASGFVLVDFEGEPARSLAERREKQSPLKDVAGMLRSFSYATYAALATASTGEPHGTVENQRSWAALWEAAACAAFLDAYREVLRDTDGLLPQPAQQDELLRALLLEKASYELMYELNNRPAWLALPLHGLLALSTD